MGRGCFGIVNINKVLAKPDDWIRRGLQMLHPGQWKRGRTAFRALSVRGASKRVAAQVSGHSHRWWRTARGVIHHIPGKFDFDQMGFLRLDESLRSIEPPWYGPVCSVVREGNLGDFFSPWEPNPYWTAWLVSGVARLPERRDAYRPLPFRVASRRRQECSPWDGTDAERWLRPALRPCRIPVFPAGVP
ncbi:MAG: hypothetical protein ACI87O_003201 [Planctomycetota bacterium]|jgi:hypothetical protein